MTPQDRASAVKLESAEYALTVKLAAAVANGYGLTIYTDRLIVIMGPIIASALSDTRRKALEEAARAVEAYRMTGPSPIGALHGVGWNEAIARAAAEIRRLKGEGE